MIFLFVSNDIWTITVMGWLIVFVALLFLVSIFIFIPKVINWFHKRAKKRREGRLAKVADDEETMLTGEMNAAISMALYLYFNEIHDEESNIITIKEVRRRYSPWSSKLYGMNNMNFPR